MAALTTAGFRASDLYDDDEDRTLFGSAGFPFNKVTDVLGSSSWVALRCVRWLGAALQLAQRWWWLLFGLLLAVVAVGLCSGASPQALLVCGLACVGVLGLGAVGVACVGIVSLSQLRKNLDLALRWKCAASGHPLPPPGQPITFAQAKAMEWKPLKIVASNISERRIEVFCESLTPQVGIADAVAASICIPFLFRAVYLEGNGCTYVDGGMLSNLPAWVFEEERALNPEAAVVAVELDESRGSSALRNRLSGLAFLGALIQTAVFGAGALSKRVRGLMIPLQLQPIKRDGQPLQLLEFDVARDDARAIIADARKYALEKLVDQLVNIPWELRNFTEDVRDLVQRVFADETLGALFRSGEHQPCVRVAIATKPRNHLLSWKLHDGAGFEDGHPDRGVYLPDPGSLVAEAVRTGGIELATKQRLDELCNAGGLAGQNLQANAWSELRWSLAIPPKGSEPCSVLVIDSNAEMAVEPELLLKRLDSSLKSIQHGFTALQPRIRDMEPR